MTDLLPEFERILIEAGKIAQREREHLERSLKSDGSIVTNADRDVEVYLRRTLADLVPNTGFWGEEFGIEPAGPDGLWLVDPVDGTSNFSFGSPLWGVTAALVRGDDIVLGGVSLPDLNELTVCAKGGGVMRNGKCLAPIPPGPILAHELVSCCESNLRKIGDCLPGKQRCAGSFVVEGTFVAAQRLRGMIGGGECLYDAAACILFGQELGAEIRYANGDPLEIEAHVTGARFARPWIIFPASSGFQVP